ncbi:MAG: LSM domain-containing protein [Candidatus Hodarchaeota archaeon]
MDFLRKKIGYKITVILKNNEARYTGKLLCYDINMNLALDKVHKESGNFNRGLGKTLIRGNNILFIIL